MQVPVVEFPYIHTAAPNLVSNINYHVEMREPLKTLRVSKSMWILDLSYRYIGRVLAEGLLISRAHEYMLRFDLHLKPNTILAPTKL